MTLFFLMNLGFAAGGGAPAAVNNQRLTLLGVS